MVLEYRKNETESYLEFSSRAFRHLKLCSRLQPVGQRERYIEDKRVKILKNNLPQTVLDEILKKEMIFQNFSSTEILDHMISYCHKEKGSINQFDKYDVNLIRSKPTTIKVIKKINSLKKQS